MIAALRRQLAMPAFARRLSALAADAPAAALLSLEIPLGCGTTDWLHALPSATPFWYHARPIAGEYRLGLGHAWHITSAGSNRFTALDHAFTGLCRHWRTTTEALAFSGFAFDPASDATLPNALLAVPALLLECHDGTCRAILTTTAARSTEAPGEWLALLAAPPIAGSSPFSRRPASQLADHAWQARVQAALREIASGRLDKVVLSRHLRLEASTAFSPAAILQRLLETQPDSLTYAYSNGRQCFLGATPEQLVRLDGRQATADALAGTAWRGSAALDNDKNRHEQSLVVRAVLDALRELAIAPPEHAPAEAVSAGQVIHLRSRITATLAPEIGVFDLVRALHPTPAVGGYPRRAALDWLHRHDEKRSAWYSGGFGLLRPNGDGEFAVALRCALLDARGADLQAGAGIVAGSDPTVEEAEIEAKLNTLLNALSQPSGARTGTGDS